MQTQIVNGNNLGQLDASPIKSTRRQQDAEKGSTGSSGSSAPESAAGVSGPSAGLSLLLYARKFVGWERHARAE